MEASAVESSYEHPEDLGLHNDWLQLMEYYNPCIEMLRKPTEFTDDEIEEFQSLTDSFYEKWIELVGVEGITNYVHMLGSRHISY